MCKAGTDAITYENVPGARGDADAGGRPWAEDDVLFPRGDVIAGIVADEGVVVGTAFGLVAGAIAEVDTTLVGVVGGAAGGLVANGDGVGGGLVIVKGLVAKAVLEEPVVLEERALRPKAVLEEPVVLEERALRPKAVL
ncbi:MAG: hypothetical protein KatS3mg099_448 [Candidatus Parcubacteria bacterium]|nr:MAG: hypothetical protein KatS3mg099_448 [Candidatus Parcubacteria bacterium]